MPRCVVINCNSSKKASTQSQEHISHHLFPQDPYVKEKRIDATGRKNWFPTKHSTICSIHFNNTSFIEGKKLRLLKKTAYPTINILECIDNIDMRNDRPPGPALLSRKRKSEKDVKELPILEGQSESEKILLNRINNAQEKIEQQKKVIKRLKQQNRRKDKKNLTLMTLLKSFVNDEQANLLQSTNVRTRELYSRLQKTKNKVNIKIINNEK